MSAMGSIIDTCLLKRMLENLWKYQESVYADSEKDIFIIAFILLK